MTLLSRRTGADHPDDVSALGWRTIGQLPYRSSVEGTQGSTWTLARLWSTPARLEAQPLGDDVSRIIVGVDGIGMLTLGGVALRLEPKQMLIVDDRDELVSENQMQWARCEWHLTSPMLRQGLFAGLLRRPLTLPPANYMLITAMTNVVATQKGFESSGPSGFLHDCFANVIAASLLDIALEDPDAAPYGPAYRDALSIIDDRHRDHGFGVGELAAELYVSDRQLRRIFAPTGGSPRDAIESRRIASALSALSAFSAQQGTSPDEGDAWERSALSAGFSSARQLRDALRRQDRRHRKP